MSRDQVEPADQNSFHQTLSAMVRARLLFKREIEIDGAARNKFDSAYFQRLIEIKSRVDQEMTKLLGGSVTLTLLFYLVGSGVDPQVPLWGLRLSEVPGVLVFLALSGAYALSMSAFAFMNSQTYVALIDQVILEESDDGLIDPDLLKASYEREWLIFKVLRKDFNMYLPVYIRMGALGTFLNGATFVMMTVVAVSPFLVLLIVQPYLAISLLPNDWVGLAAKAFSVLSATSALAIVIVANFGFGCEVDLARRNNSEAGSD